MAIAEALIPLAEAAGDLARLSHTLHLLVWLHGGRAEYDQSRRYLAQARAIAERRGDTVLLAMLDCAAGWAALHTGAWEQARAYFGHAVSLGSAGGPSRASKEPLIALAQLSLLTGAREDVERYLRESQAIGASNNVEWARRMEEILLAQRALVEGQPEEARARLTPLLATADQEPFVIGAVLTTLARAHLDLGEAGQAALLVSHELAEARRRHWRLDLVEALWLQARVATHQEDWEGARAALNEGLDLARRLPYPHAEGRLLHLYGTVHIEQREPRLAREKLEAALTIFRHLGARTDAQEVERAMTDLGPR
jgi:hypothetical protein